MIGTVGRRHPLGRWDFVVAALLLLVGGVNLLLPFTGDQAQFTVGSAQLADGSVLYRDYWDQKQPGIYAFYVVGGSLFGFSELGLHLWELLYFLAFALVVRLTIAEYVTRTAVARLAPLIVVGVQLAGARAFDLGQVETLVGFPLYVSLVSALRVETDPRRRMRWLVLFGVATGVVGVFKHFYALIPLFWFAHTLLRLARSRRASAGSLVRVSVVAAAACAAVLLPVIGYFAAHGLLERIWWTYFVYSPRTVELDPRPLSRLATGLGRLALIYAPLFALAALAFVGRRGRGPDRVAIDLVAGVALGLLLLLAQSWWSYHFVLILAPVALLAVRGLDRLPAPQLRPGPVAVVLALLLAAPLATHFANKVLVIVRNGFGLAEDGRAAIWREVEPTYAKAAEALAPLSEPEALQGDIYVFGNPLYVYLSGRRYAIPAHGWSPEFNDAAMWQEIRDDLASAAPPYIFTESGYAELVAERDPATMALIASAYEPISTTDGGTLYRRR